MSQYTVFRVHTVDGGLVTSFSPRLLNTEMGYASEFINMTTKRPGLPMRRPGMGEVETLAVVPLAVHEFVKLSTDVVFPMISYADKVDIKDGSVWVTLVDGLESEVPMEFETFADQVVFTNGVDSVMAWDGEAEEVDTDLGAETATMRTFLLYENNDLRYTAKTAGVSGNHIRIRYMRPDEPSATTTITVTGAGTDEDPYFINVLLAWEIDEEDEQVNVLTTAADAKTAIEAHETVNGLVAVVHVPGSDGSMTLTEMPERALTGGYDAVQGKFLTEYRLRLLIFDKNKMNMSHTGDPHLWSPTKAGSNAVEAFIAPDDDEEISGVLSMGDGGVLIGKPNSLYGLFGYKRDNFVIDQLDPNIGVSSHKSMTFSRPFGYFVHHSGIYRIQPGGMPEKISVVIQDLFDSVVDFTKLEESVGFIHDRMYVICLPTADGTVTLCWHLDHERWVTWTEPSNLRQTVHTQGGLWYIKDNENTIFTIDDSLSKDYGTEEIPMRYHSLEFDAGQPEVEKDIGELYLIFRGADEPYTVTYEIWLDGVAFITHMESVIDNIAGKQQVVRVPVGRTCRFLEVRMDCVGGEFVPMALYFTYQPKEVL